MLQVIAGTKKRTYLQGRKRGKTLGYQTSLAKQRETLTVRDNIAGSRIISAQFLRKIVTNAFPLVVRLKSETIVLFVEETCHPCDVIQNSMRKAQISLFIGSAP